MRRYLLTARWLALHALVVVLVAAFLALGWWQWHRGEAGNTRSFAYALEWPLFALFTLFMWARLIRDDMRSRAAGQPAPPATDPPAAAANPSTPAAGPGPAAPSPGHAQARPAALPRVARRQDRPEPDDGEVDEELAAYNRYLARLNAEAEQGR